MKKIINGIEVDVIKRNVKSIRIKIDRELNVSLIIPSRCSEKAGVDFFVSKINWVKNKLTQKPVKREVDFANKGKVFVFGKEYEIVTVQSSVNRSFIDGDKLVICAKNTERDNIKAQYEKFLKESLLDISSEYFAKWEEKTGLKKTSLAIRKTVSRWGSCNSLTGAINLSLYLACLPEICLDYVVLHELCHLRYANHGEFFKRELDKFMPNWRNIRSFLREKVNGYLYK